MPLSHLRRPLFLFAVSYLLLLAALRACGVFEAPAPRGWPRRDAAARVEGRVASACLETHLGDRFLLQAEAAGREPALVQAYLPRGGCARLEPRPGQRLELRGRLRRPRPALQPGDFDERGLLDLRGVSLVLHARAARALDREVPPGWLALAWAEAARRSAQRAFRERLAADHARLLEGLLFGYKGALDPALQRRIQDAGATHLIVPSGAKVGFVVWGLAALLARLRVPRRAALGFAAAAGGFYCLMVGGEAPYLRAYAAGLAGLAAAWCPGRDAGGLQAFALSAALMMLAWPRIAFSAGFLMTYAAALAIWLAAPRWTAGWAPRRLRPALRALGISLAVQLSLWPFFANIFGRGSLAGLVANAVLVPASAWLMASGVALWGASPWPPAASAAAWLATRSLTAFEGVCAFFAALPGAAVDLCPMSLGAIVVWYGACLGLFLLPQLRPALLVWALTAGAWGAQAAAAWSRGPRLEACLFGDGRGWAAWVKLPEGPHLLVDAGLAPARLSYALRELGARPVHTALVTSPEPWAARGLAVHRRWPVRRVLAPRGLPTPQGLPAGPLAPGFEERWGAASVRVPARPAAPGGRLPVEVRFRGFRLTFAQRPGLATVSRGEGAAELCLLQGRSVAAPPECFEAGIRGVGRGGALWIVTDGDRYAVSSSAAAWPLGRPAL